MSVRRVLDSEAGEGRYEEREGSAGVGLAGWELWTLESGALRARRTGEELPGAAVGQGTKLMDISFSQRAMWM